MADKNIDIKEEPCEQSFKGSAMVNYNSRIVF